MNNADKPAMPIGEQMDGAYLNPTCNGLTKREHFAAMAMQGFLSGAMSNGRSFDYFEYCDAAEFSVRQADALLKALED